MGKRWWENGEDKNGIMNKIPAEEQSSMPTARRMIMPFFEKTRLHDFHGECNVRTGTILLLKLAHTAVKVNIKEHVQKKKKDAESLKSKSSLCGAVWRRGRRSRISTMVNRLHVPAARNDPSTPV